MAEKITSGAADAARLAAEAAARKAAAEAAARAAAAKAAAEKAAAEKAAQARLALPPDEMSTGMGTALRTRAAQVTGASTPLATEEAAVTPPVAADAAEVSPAVKATVDAVIAPTATQAQRDDAYAQVQAYAGEAGTVDAAEATRLLVDASIPVAATPDETTAPAAADHIAQLADSGAPADEVRAAVQAELDRFPGNTAYQQALATELAKRMDANNPINAGCEDIQKRNKALGDAIVFATENGGREVAQAFARGFASVADDQAYSRPGGVVMGDYFADALGDAMRDQGAIRLGLALTEELGKTGNLTSAGRVHDVTRYAMDQVQQRFNDLNGDLEALQADLGAALGPVGGALTEEQQNAAVAEFQRRSAGKLEEWERAGAQYAEMMQALGETDALQSDPELQGYAQSFVQDLPALSGTQAGMEFLSEEIEKQGLGKPGFMDFVAGLGAQGKLTPELSDGLSAGITRAVGMRVLAYAQSGQVGEAGPLLDGLRRNAAIFGVDDATMNGIVDTLRTLHPGMSQAELEAFTSSYKGKLDAAIAAGANPTGGAMEAFRTLGVLAGAAHVVQEGLSQQDVLLRTQFLSQAIGMGAKGGIAAVQAINASGIFAANAQVSGWVNTAGKLFRTTGALTGGVSAIIEGISAAQAFADGRVLDGAASAQTAIGGLLMTAAALQVIPGWGQVAGATLLFTGFVTSFFAGQAEEGRIKDLRRDLLLAAGLPETAANAFRDANEDRMRELMDEMKLSPAQIQELATNWPYLITQGEGNGVSFQGIKNLQAATGLSNDQLMTLFRSVGTGEEADRSISMLLGNTAGAWGDTTSLQGWLDIANANLQGSLDAEYTRVWTIIRDTLSQQQP